jgi:hypothetical protein
LVYRRLYRAPDNENFFKVRDPASVTKRNVKPTGWLERKVIAEDASRPPIQHDHQPRAAKPDIHMIMDQLYVEKGCINLHLVKRP